MRFLFVKSRLEWPRTYGHDVHCFEMMRALAALGHEVALATDVTPQPRAIAGLHLAESWTLQTDSTGDPVRLSYLQERYRSYWGIAPGRLTHLRQIADTWRADVVVVVGLEILPYLGAPTRARRIWYAADEWVWHYASQLKTDPGGAVAHVKAAAIKGLYERAYGPIMDGVWVVSDAERRAMRIVAGARHVDVVPNGVDTSFFSPTAVAPAPRSAVFWGRLGFGPNLQALRWFCGQVWPLIRKDVPDATFAIVGADPPPEVRAYDGQQGMRVIPNPIDLRPDVSACSVVVMPFVSGGGIKNKFLEAAAMGRPIVATALATRGLKSQPPVSLANQPREFAAAVTALWADAPQAAALGAAARQWVEAHHTWQATAEAALRGLQSIPIRG